MDSGHIPVISPRVALFDVDGTLVKGLLIVDFPRFLVGNGLFDRDSERAIRGLARLYKQGKATYRHISMRIPKLYAMGIRGRRRSEILDSAKTFVAANRGRLFPYSARLVSLMAENGFLNIAVSGSPIEVVRPLVALGFRRVFGSEMEVRNGTYTGKLRRNLILAEEKQKVVNALIANYHIDAENSFAFGDTEQDLPLLSSVGHPIPLNPTASLRILAARRGWSVPRRVLEELEPLIHRIRIGGPRDSLRRVPLSAS